MCKIIPELLFSKKKKKNGISVETESCPSTKMPVFWAQRMIAWCHGLPCLTNVWLVSRRISQPSTIMRSIAKFFLMFSVSLTSSCIILRTRRHVTPNGTSGMSFAVSFNQSKLFRQNQGPVLRNALNTETSNDVFTLLCLLIWTVCCDFQVPRKLLQLGFCIIQTVSLYMLMRCVGQEFVKREDVAGNLQRHGSKAVNMQRGSHRRLNVSNAQRRSRARAGIFTCIYANERVDQ